jgi:hypothetical protein
MTANSEQSHDKLQQGFGTIADIIYGDFCFNLPDGSVLEMDWIPHEGWGTKPGMTYSTYPADDDSPEARTTWTVPR